VLRYKQQQLRDMQRQRERERGKRVLEVDADGGVGGGGDESTDDEGGGGGDDAAKRATRFEDDLRALDLDVHVDLRAAQRAVSNGGARV